MIGIIGFGRFGRLAAQYLARDVNVLVFARSGKRVEIEAVGAGAASFEEVCAQPTILLCVPISTIEKTLREISPHLNRNSLVVDVCSVKELPVQWMERHLPGEVSYLPTHPMFGPDSADTSLDGRKIVLCRGRVDAIRYENIKSWLVSKGLVIIETTAAEHDRKIAVSLGLTHFIGRALEKFGAGPLDIDTEGYKRLLHILDVVQNDTIELFRDMHTYNPHARDARDRFADAMSEVDRLLR
ncbi:MAG: prephenate dehydrogenase/arogenate dehydrogenase family protein [Desulfobacteraceae bacterium]|nr:prephenate dehydrogenase/arogenate dehydrogenase family protein [Desulfobacteraceae bacterium]